MNSAIVIGAGIAGLTAAYKLKKAGYNVLVLEANNYVGGRMFTEDWHGFRVNGGAKFVTTSDKSLLDMVKELAIEDQLVKPQKGIPINIYRNGKIHEANFLSVLSYIRWSGVSLGARIAMLKLLPHILRVGKINPYHLEQASITDSPVTFEEFFKDAISEEMFEYWAIPMFETMCAYKGTDVSKKAFLALMAVYLNANTVGFKNGVGALPERLAQELEIRLSAKVTSVSYTQDAVKVSWIQDSVNMSEIADIAVMAVPGNLASSLLHRPRKEWVNLLSRVSYSTGAMHYHLVETDYQPRIKSTFIPRILSYPINNIAFEQYKNGHWLILTDPSVYTFRMGTDISLLNQNASSVIRQIYPDFEGKFVDHRIFRWQNKLPTFRPGYLNALEQFWQNPNEGPIYFCGDYLAGPSTGAALYTGLEVVKRIIS